MSNSPATINRSPGTNRSPRTRSHPATTLAASDNAVLRIELDGASAGALVTGLTLSGDGSILRGMTVEDQLLEARLEKHRADAFFLVNDRQERHHILANESTALFAHRGQPPPPMWLALKTGEGLPVWRVNAGRDFAQHARANHQLLTDDVGISRIFAKRVEKVLRPTHKRGELYWQ